MIYHITTPEIWRQALENGYFKTSSLEGEGFIHCCLEDQIPGVINRYYSHLQEILLLQIDESELSAPVRYEISSSVNESFPHVYGMIEMAAIKDTVKQFIKH